MPNTSALHPSDEQDTEHRCPFAREVSETGADVEIDGRKHLLEDVSAVVKRHGRWYVTFTGRTAIRAANCPRCGTSLV